TKKTKAARVTTPEAAAAAKARAWTHLELFDEWVLSRAEGGPGVRERLTPEAAAGYRFFWNSFVRWLTTAHHDAQGKPTRARRRSYKTASAADIDAYLGGQVSTSSPTKAAVSPITLVRYGSLLEWIYDFAVAKGAVKHNPANARTTGAARALRAAGKFDPAGEGLVLNALQWEAVLAAVPPIDSTDPMQIRDRAILLVLMDAHLTSRELCDLDVSNIGYALEDRDSYTVDVTQFTRRSQERSLVLDRKTSEAIKRWLQVRAAMKLSAKDQALFVTERRRRLSKRVLIYVVSRTMRAASLAAGFDLPYHSGPQVLRNSRIVFRLNRGVPVKDVVADAGLKNHYSFRGLRQHLNPEVAKIVTPVARSKRPEPKS
ncbi:MAG: tyrosine-type recombinase/integrase, partial [Burkholderiaceae bacterium]|nr:tyrosine-type recombinase/integrase [Burkholderiaceae bacterium]